MTKAKKVDVDVGLVLQLINDCQEFNTMPKPGGMLEQDSLFMHLFHGVQEARAVRAELDSKKSNS